MPHATTQSGTLVRMSICARVATGALICCLAGAAGACSLIYDAGDFHASDAMPADSTMPPPDVDPTRLALTSVSPDTVLEGEGSLATGRAIPILVSGDSIAQDAVIRFELAGAGGADAGVDDAGVNATPLEVGDTVVSIDGTMAATTIRVPVLETVGQGETLALRVVVDQMGASAGLDFTVTGLDELDVAGGTLTTQTAGLAPAYSRITFAQPVHLAGTDPARFHATAEIIVSAPVDADGQADGSPGSGGCPGGAGETVGDCGAGGGGQGTSGVLQSGPGGGGGGFGGVGQQGAGGKANSPAGSGGMATGNDMLVPIATEAGQPGNRGNGGGGGGTGTLGGNGGNGGGGGGAIELRSDGTITLTSGGAVRAAGGQGAAGGGLGGGSGGGGSGGAILIHAPGGLIDETAGNVVSAAFGSSAGNGGDGSVGRIRIDSPTDPAASVGSPAPVRGPLWRADLPAIVREASVTGTVIGAPGRAFAVWVDDNEQPTVTPGGSGTKQVTVPLVAGHNNVCVFAGAQADFRDEAAMCRDVVYLP